MAMRDEREQCPFKRSVVETAQFRGHRNIPLSRRPFGTWSHYRLQLGHGVGMWTIYAARRANMQASWVRVAGPQPSDQTFLQADRYLAKQTMDLVRHWMRSAR